MKNKGISLIVLIITIVVIVIMSTAIILNLTQTNIIGNAKSATVKMRGSDTEEFINMWSLENFVNEYTNGSIKTEEDLLGELKKNKLVFEEEIDRVNKTITIGDKEISYSVASSNSNTSVTNIIGQMDVCWTLGNSLDNDSGRAGLTVEDYETSWDNPVTTNEMIKAVKNAGFDTIRIPVTWFNHLDEQNKIDEDWMKRVKEVVDYAINNGMITILNVHHDDKLLGLEDDEVEFSTVINKYSYVWEQIANVFKNYDQKLLFEIINEPRVILEDGSSVWAPETDTPYENLNNFCKEMLNTIRSTGGNNSSRGVLIPTYGTLITNESLGKLDLPNDSNIAVSVHGYLPYEYCSDNTTEYTDSMYDSMKYKIDLITEFSKANNVPVVITELGCYEKSDRNEWLKDIYTYCNYNGIKLIWWDNGDEYKIFDRTTLKVIDESAFNIIKSSYENVENLENDTSANITEGINTTTSIQKDNSDMEVQIIDGKNHYCLDTTLTSSCRFKFTDVYEINEDYDFFEFSYKVKTDMEELKLKLVMNFMDEDDNVIYTVNYQTISNEIDGTKELYEIKKLYKVEGAKKVQIERLAISPNSDEGQDVNIDIYDIKIKGI